MEANPCGGRLRSVQSHADRICARLLRHPLCAGCRDSGRSVHHPTLGGQECGLRVFLLGVKETSRIEILSAVQLSALPSCSDFHAGHSSWATYAWHPFSVHLWCMGYPKTTLPCCWGEQAEDARVTLTKACLRRVFACES